MCIPTKNPTMENETKFIVSSKAKSGSLKYQVAKHKRRTFTNVIKKTLLYLSITVVGIRQIRPRVLADKEKLFTYMLRYAEKKKAISINT